MLSRGLPSRHHVVVYVHARLLDPLTSSHLEMLLNLDVDEVAAAAWLSRTMVSAVVSVSDDDDDASTVSLNEFPQTIQWVYF